MPTFKTLKTGNVLQNGAVLIEKGRNHVTGFSFVLCKVREYQYATWEINTRTCDTYHGHYFGSWEYDGSALRAFHKAVNDFRKRLGVYPRQN